MVRAPTPAPPSPSAHRTAASIPCRNNSTAMNPKLIRAAAVGALVLGLFAAPWPQALADPPATEDKLRHGLCGQTGAVKFLQRTELYFGLSRPGGVVTEEEFQTFLDAVVTPRFPDGLTVLSAKGQFREATSATPRKEDARILILLYPFSKSSNRAVEEIRESYKTRFDQQSVLRMDEASCVSF
jgi:hypothetical protein